MTYGQLLFYFLGGAILGIVATYLMNCFVEFVEFYSKEK